MKLGHFLSGELIWTSWTPAAIAADGRILAGIGEGRGTVRGLRLSGSGRWFNVPRGREDGTFVPHYYGWIDTEDRSRVMFEIRALNFQFRPGFDAGDPATSPGILGTVAFRASSDGYRWIDDVLSVMEATELPDGETWRIRLYRRIGEPLA